MDQIATMTKGEVLEWIKGIASLSDAFRQRFIEVCEANNISGAQLDKIKDKNILKEYGLSPIQSGKFLKELNDLRIKILVSAQAEGKDNDDDEFSLNLYLGKSKSKATKKWKSNDDSEERHFRVTDTIKRVREYIYYMEGGHPLDQICVIIKSVTYDQTKNDVTLKEAGIDCQYNFVDLHVKAKGGAVYIDNKEAEDPLSRKRKPNFKKGKIKPSLKPDCIMGYDEMELRVEMECGHVFAPVTVYQLQYYTLETSQEKYVRCPKCKQKWDYDTIIAAADLNQAEKSRLFMILSRRQKSSEIRYCAGCQTSISRPDNLTMQRVRCPSDSCKDRNDFCWLCNQPWQGDGFTICGNDNCSSKNVNDTLKNCAMKKVAYIVDGNDEVPAFRACPNCHTLIEHTEACKHMKCWYCKTNFCFMCLKFYDEEKNAWPCKDYDNACPVADRQVLK